MSPLRILDAENCALENIPESFVRPGINMNLKNNKIKAVPRDGMLKFLQSGGELTYNVEGKEKGGIDLTFNPMAYPPRYILEKGPAATSQHLTDYENTMIDQKENSVILIGNQMVGKTSLGLSLAGKIFNAAEIKLTDQTEAFDCYQADIKDSKLTIQWTPNRTRKRFIIAKHLHEAIIHSNK